MSEREERKGVFQIDTEFESLLQLMNDKISDLDQNVVLNQTKKAPLVVVCFTPRSGSTLLMQHLALSQKINYFSSFNARFWKAPIFSQLLEEKLGLRNSLRGIGNHELSSMYGYSNNVSLPHEFGFFWNQLLTDQTHWIDQDKVDSFKVNKFVETINSLRTLSNKPFVIKNGIASYNVKFLKALFPDLKILKINREFEFVIQSNYLARNSIYGDYNHWFSIIPRDYKKIIENSKEPIEQIVCQLERLLREFEFLDAKNVDYKDLCEKPNETINDILSWLGQPKSELCFQKIEPTDIVKVDTQILRQINRLKHRLL